jgi:hypothetical protein
MLRRLTFLKRTGTLRVCGDPQVDLQYFSHPDAIKVLSITKTLDVSRTHLTSMIGCCHFPRLTAFIADRSKIANFANFRVLGTVSTFSMKETPVSKGPTYRLSLLLAVGTKSVTSIDGIQISPNLQSKLRRYPDTCRQLVNLGWLASSKPPSREEIESLCAEYSIEVPMLHSDSEELISYVQSDAGSDTFEDLIGRLKSEDEDVRRRGKAQFGLVDEQTATDYSAGELFADIADIMRSRGIDGELKTDDDLFNAVERLCRDRTPPEARK